MRCKTIGVGLKVVESPSTTPICIDSRTSNDVKKYCGLSQPHDCDQSRFKTRSRSKVMWCGGGGGG